MVRHQLLFSSGHQPSGLPTDWAAPWELTSQVAPDGQQGYSGLSGYQLILCLFRAHCSFKWILQFHVHFGGSGGGLLTCGD